MKSKLGKWAAAYLAAVAVMVAAWAANEAKETKFLGGYGAGGTTVNANVQTQDLQTADDVSVGDDLTVGDDVDISGGLAVTGATGLTGLLSFDDAIATGNVQVLGSLAVDTLGSVSIVEDDAAATITMDGTLDAGEGEGEGEPGPTAYTGIYPIGRGAGGAAVDDALALFEVKTEYWDGDSLEDGPLFAMANGLLLMGMPDFSGAISINPGAVSLAGDVSANDSVTAESLATTDGGLTMASAALWPIIETDAYTDGAGTTLRKALAIPPKLDGVSGGFPLEYYQKNDGAGDVDIARWVIGNTGVFLVENDGTNNIVKIGDSGGALVEIGGVTIGQVDVTTDATIAGTTAVELLTIGFDDTGDGYASIDPQGFIDSTAAVRASSLQRTESASITAAATISLDCAAHDVFDVTANQNITVGAPTNATDVQTIFVRWKQNGTGGYQPTWDGVFRFGNHTNAATGTANATTIWQFMRNDAANKWDCLGVTTGLS